MKKMNMVGDRLAVYCNALYGAGLNGKAWLLFFSCYIQGNLKFVSKS